MVRIAAILSVMIVATVAALENGPHKNSLKIRGEGKMVRRQFPGMGGGMGFPSTVPGLMGGFSSITTQIQSLQSAFMGGGLGVQMAMQQIQQLAMMFQSFFSSFSACSACMSGGQFGSFGGSIMSMFTQFQSLVSACQGSFGGQCGNIFGPFSGLSGMFNSFFSQIQSTGMSFGGMLPAGLTSTFSSIGMSQTTGVLNSFGFK